jgi:uncharacterized protein
METLTQPAPWWVAGPLIGLLIVALRWVGNQPFGALGGYVDLADRLAGVLPSFGWRTWFALGTIGGGALYAFVTRTSALDLDYGSLDASLGGSLPLKAAFLVVAGMMMGFGARTAGGCTSGHGMCGIVAASPASFVATGTFMAVAVATSLLLSGVLP